MNVAVGFIIYSAEAAKYLPYFLNSLKAQTCTDFKIFAIDNNENKDNDNVEIIKSNYPQVEIEWAGGNIGFGRAHNLMIKKSIERGFDYYIPLNTDMMLEKNAIEVLVKVMNENPELGSVSPKILKWDFANNKKTDYIDSMGIKKKSGLRFKDLGQGLKDNDRYDNATILGPSGAAGIFRLEALKKIADEHGFYDERIFMYKEDCDLAYRLKLAGFKARIASRAIIYHDRTVKVIKKGFLTFFATRADKSKQVKIWSFFSQNLIYYKYWKYQKIGDKFIIVVRVCAMLAYSLIFERFLISQYINVWKSSSMQEFDKS